MADSTVTAGENDIRLQVLKEMLTTISVKIHTFREVLLDDFDDAPSSANALVDALSLVGWIADEGANISGGGGYKKDLFDIYLWALGTRTTEMIEKIQASGVRHG